VPIVVLTGLDDQSLAIEAMRVGAQDYLVKGQVKSGLPRTIRYAIERKRAEWELQQRTEDLALINALNDAANRGESLEEITRLVTRNTKRIFSSYGATVYLLNEAGTDLIMQNPALPPATVKRIEALIGMTIPRVEIPLGASSLYRELLKGHTPRLSNDPEVIQQVIAELAETVPLPGRLRHMLRRLVPQIRKLLDIQSMVTIPLVSAGEAIGLMEFSRTEPFDESDKRRLEAIAKPLVAAIQRRRALEQIQKQSAFL